MPRVDIAPAHKLYLSLSRSDQSVCSLGAQHALVVRHASVVMGSSEALCKALLTLLLAASFSALNITLKRDFFYKIQISFFKLIDILNVSLQ